MPLIWDTPWVKILHAHNVSFSRIYLNGGLMLMKSLVLFLFLYFSFFAACDTDAGDSTMSTSYPAPRGSYVGIQLTNLQTGANGNDFDCSKPANNGLLFMDPNTTNTLQICTKDGTKQPVAFPQACFNQFCSYCPTCSSPTTSCTPASQCADGFIRSTTVQNTFSSDGKHQVNVYLCCSTHSTINNFDRL